ncbi:hypothetical protein [Paenibacillus dokdonensis]|uniref:hypothetical protein n=1 Tax=Paenibacillus dokdonensis TaxID=2567944 RepID=UPI003D2DB948
MKIILVIIFHNKKIIFMSNLIIGQKSPGDKGQSGFIWTAIPQEMTKPAFMGTRAFDSEELMTE